jgi:hypothetical protein
MLTIAIQQRGSTEIYGKLAFGIEQALTTISSQDLVQHDPLATLMVNVLNFKR